MPDPKRFDLIVIGTGPGGYVAAIRAAQLGLKTAVVERDQLGGTCLNWGCIPTKAWIVTAHLYDQIRRAREYGIEVADPRIRWEWLVERKNKVVKQLTGGVKILLTGRQVEIFHGHARQGAQGLEETVLKSRAAPGRPQAECDPRRLEDQAVKLETHRLALSDRRGQRLNRRL